jgi:Protein of Unknown function (DUF2784)
VLYRALAYGTALSHLAFVVALVGGAWWVARRPERWKLHLPVVVAMATVSLAGADCPLTVLENHFRELGGWERYGSGFISHYLVEPLHPAGITPAVRALIIALWVVPNALAYAVVVRDRRRLTAARGW